MLKTINFAVFKCMECGNTIKVNPSQPVEKIECECSQTKVEEAPKKRKPRKKVEQEDA